MIDIEFLLIGVKFYQVALIHVKRRKICIKRHKSYVKRRELISDSALWKLFSQNLAKGNQPNRYPTISEVLWSSPYHLV